MPNLAPVSRRSVAEALVTVTVALSAKEPGAPEGKVLRQALFAALAARWGWRWRDGRTVTWFELSHG